MIRTVIIDDDKQIREGFAKKLGMRYSRIIRVIGNAKNVSTGVKKVNELEPDLLFLDMDMPDGSGFDLLNRIDSRPYVVLITASKEHGIEAVNQGIDHYITKPVENDELDLAVFKVQRLLRAKKLIEEGISSGNTDAEILVVSSADGHMRIKPKEIIYCESEGMYSTLHMLHDEAAIISKPSKGIMEILPAHLFLRVSQSVIINKKHAVLFDREGYIHLSTGQRFRVSARLKGQIKKLLFS